MSDRPEVPVISGYKTGNDLTVGQHLSLICRVTGGNPVPSLQWYRDGQLLDDTFGLERRGSRVTVNALDIVVQESDNGAEYECRATSPLQTRPLLAAITLSVHCNFDCTVHYKLVLSLKGLFLPDIILLYTKTYLFTYFSPTSSFVPCAVDPTTCYHCP